MTRTIQLQQEWHLGQELASGGFAKVYLTRSPKGTEAVLKRIPKAPGADRELLFEDLAGVPNVVPVFDRGEWEDYWVLVMARAEKSLRQQLNQQADHLSLQEAIAVLTDIAQALVAIEGRVVHRDIKPENILLLEGSWCLADFGIARYAEATTEPDTRKHAMTPPYAAPEQWRGERATTATDIYATGVIVYEMLAGHRPFPGPEVHDYRRQHLEETPGPVSNTPLPLQSLIAECLYKAPEARPKPQNLLARLGASEPPASSASERLQQAYHQQVERQAEEARQRFAAETEADRRAALYQSAEQSLSHLARALHARIAANAPASVPSGGILWPCELNRAQLTVAPLRGAVPPKEEDQYQPPFEIIAFSNITVRIPPDRHGYEGRSHSLWCCDAQEAGVFRWYETAFMVNPLIPKRGRRDPFALDPGEDAYGALSPVMGEFQVAWPFTAIDQGNEEEFIERWVGWFADAAEGRLSHPSSMPERNPTGSWRR